MSLWEQRFDVCDQGSKCLRPDETGKKSERTDIEIMTQGIDQSPPIWRIEAVDRVPIEINQG